MAWTRERRKSPQGRAVSSLMRHLAWSPSPDEATLRRWIEDLAAKLQLPPDAIRAYWRPTLVKRGVWGAGGRPAKLVRCQIVADEWRRQPPSQGQRGAQAFWPRVADLVSIAEKINPPLNGDEIRKWKSKHPAHDGCPLTGVGAQSAKNSP